MDIQSIMDMFGDIRKSSAANLTIGEMLERLSQFKDEEKVIFSNGRFFDGTYDSYRGYYEDLYIGESEEDKGFNTVGKLKEVLNKALKDGVMYGYKGGEFEINMDTLVWLSTYGSCGDMIVDILSFDEKILIITKED